MSSFQSSCLLLFIMSLAVPNELNKADLSLNSQTSLTDVRLPHALTSSTHRLGIDIPPNLEQLQPLITQLNQRGLQSLSEQDYNQALVFFQEGQNLLEMVAGCGKSIDRQLILTILNNQAFVYHQKGKLDLSKRYVEAVIFNINSYLNHPSQTSLSLQIKQSIEGQASQVEVAGFLQSQWSAVKTFINRTKELSTAQLQYAALLAENHQNSASALMGLRSIKSMIEHFHLSSIYQTIIEKGHECGQNKIISDIIEFDSQFSLAYFQDLEREVKDRMEGLMGPAVLQLSEMDQNRLSSFSLTDFLNNKPQEYKGTDISSASHRISIDCSLSNFLQKYFQIGCAYYLVGASMMRELNETQYLLGSSSEYETNKRLSIREAELYYLYSLKLILQYVPLSSLIAKELIEAFNSRFNQEYRVRVRAIQVPKDHGSSKQNKSNVSEKSKTESISSSSNKDRPISQMDRLLPPTVDNFVLDLSCADSIDLNSNASMLELLKEGEETQKADEDEQIYFQFMPKKSTSVNPLFEATTNLQELRNQVKLKGSAKKETCQISIQRSLQSYHEIEEKKEKKEKKKKKMSSSRKRSSEIRSKSNKKNSLERRADMKSIKRKGDPSFQTHYLSAYDLSNKERSSKNKSRMPEIKSARLLLVNANPQTLKKPSRNQSKFISEKNIRLNKVKSPVGKPKNEKIELTRDTATRHRQRQKSKPQSIKAHNSKPKSLRKGLEPKKSQGKLVNIYLQRKQ